MEQDVEQVARQVFDQVRKPSEIRIIQTGLCSGKFEKGRRVDDKRPAGKILDPVDEISAGRSHLDESQVFVNQPLIGRHATPLRTAIWRWGGGTECRMPWLSRHAHTAL